MTATRSHAPATRSPLDRHPSPVAESGDRRNRATASLVLGPYSMVVLTK